MLHDSCRYAFAVFALRFDRCRRCVVARIRDVAMLRAARLRRCASIGAVVDRSIVAAFCDVTRLFDVRCALRVAAIITCVLESSVRCAFARSLMFSRCVGYAFVDRLRRWVPSSARARSMPHTACCRALHCCGIVRSVGDVVTILLHLPRCHFVVASMLHFRASSMLIMFGRWRCLSMPSMLLLRCCLVLRRAYAMLRVLLRRLPSSYVDRWSMMVVARVVCVDVCRVACSCFLPALQVRCGTCVAAGTCILRSGIVPRWDLHCCMGTLQSFVTRCCRRSMFTCLPHAVGDRDRCAHVAFARCCCLRCCCDVLRRSLRVVLRAMR